MNRLYSGVGELKAWIHSEGGFTSPLSRKLAILAAAVFAVWASEVLAAETPRSTTQPQSDSSQKTSSSASSASKRSVSKKGRRVAASKVRRARAVRRRRLYSPWRISSFADSAAEDDPTGDDPMIRRAAIEALGNWNGSIVVVNPNNGRILSIVNQKLALSGAFTPCSTFKPVVALAALKEGIITPRTKLRVGRRLGMSLTEALAKSNNTFFSKLGEMLGFPRLADYAHLFGLGERAGDDIPGESPGRFPAAPPQDGGVGYLAYYGQGIEVTPLQMAAVISAIANGGTFYELQYPRTPEEVAGFEPKVRRNLDDLAQYFPQIKEGLAAAVLYGTARSAYDPEVPIYGKTGTCSENGARLGWFVSYAAEQEPKYVVVVLLRGGRMIFGPHAAEIAGRLYHDLVQKQHAAEIGGAASSSTAALSVSRRIGQRVHGGVQP
jgi:membrane carboxypeptidase/penicillin-binding protein